MISITNTKRELSLLAFPAVLACVRWSFRIELS